MPEYHQIQTCVELEKRDFSQVLSNYQILLASLNCLTDTIKNWLQTIPWEVADDGFVYTGCNNDLWVSLSSTKANLKLSPHLLGITPLIFPQLKNNWVEVAFLIESESIDDLSHFPAVHYQPGVGPTVCQIMAKFAEVFPQSCIYFSDEAQDGNAWEGLIEGNRDKIWEFELASIPATHQSWYCSLSEKYFSSFFNSQLWLARKAVWQNPPWE